MENNNNEQVTKPPKGRWFEYYWRPAAAWLYLAICLFDFLIGPLFFGWYSFIVKSQLIQNWIPLTLQGGALFHLAFGSIMGITAWRNPYQGGFNGGGGNYNRPMQYPPQYQTTTNTKTTHTQVNKVNRLDENGDPI